MIILRFDCLASNFEIDPIDSARGSIAASDFGAALYRIQGCIVAGIVYSG